MKDYDHIQLKPVVFMKYKTNTLIINAQNNVTACYDPEDHILNIALYLDGAHSIEEIRREINKKNILLDNCEIISLIDKFFIKKNHISKGRDKEILSEIELMKYNRVLNFFDTYEKQNFIDAQKLLNKIFSSHVLILGVGGVGSHIAYSLSVSGVGTLTLVDNDKVEISNITRQVLFTEEDIGSYKVAAAERNLKRINPKIKIQTYNKFISNEEDLEALVNEIGKVDMVVTAIDTPRGLIRYVVDNVLYDLEIPYIYLGSRGATAICGPMILKGKTNSLNQILRSKNTSIDEMVTDIVSKVNSAVYKGAVIEPNNGVAGQLAAYEVIKYITGHTALSTLGKEVNLNMDNMTIKINEYK